jgi:activating signal cointegrator complex subunit 2
MLLSWTLLSDVCHAYPKSERLRSLLHVLWARSGGIIEKSLQTGKLSLIKQLDSKVPADAEHLLNRLGPLLKVVPQAGTFMLTGSDFLDSLSSAYDKTPTHLQKKLVTIAYLGLTSLLQGEKPNYSLLSDHLYGLKTNAEQEWKSNPTKNIFLADLVTNTPLLNRIRDSSASSEAARVKNIAASLSAFQQGAVARPKRLVRRKVDKGKGKAKEDEYGHGAFGEVHVHRMSLISQVQDLFPDLGSGFVVKLLDEYNDNVEDVVAHLLEDSLPSHLANADRGEQL